MRLIIGLGNPGVRYERTRHNAGFMVLDALARETAAAWSTECQSRVSITRISGRGVLLAKPLTFMNMSGQAFRLLMSEYRLDPTAAVVIYDDLNLPLGKIRIRESGSAGGHRGLESILRVLDSDRIIRLRLGIGEEIIPEDRAGFVLSDFPAQREPEVKEMIARGVRAAESIVTEGTSRAMSVFNA